MGLLRLGINKKNRPTGRKASGAVGSDSRYNRHMFLARSIITLLEGMFFTGLVGSAVVVIISFVEDTHELLGKDEPNS